MPEPPPAPAPQADDGMVEARVLMAKVTGDQVVWMLEGFPASGGGGVRELRAVRLDGSQARRLARLADGAAPRFSVAGDAVVWEQGARGTEDPTKPLTDVWQVPLAGGRAALLPGAQGWTLAHDGPWPTDSSDWAPCRPLRTVASRSATSSGRGRRGRGLGPRDRPGRGHHAPHPGPRRPGRWHPPVGFDSDTVGLAAIR
ncbi:hypothetical protein GCM10023170_072960 [Phytohabitans houttuyneae]|uniref:Uncharacterized protein n=2 Tax=Phytohabitans houttuyneae TaxID=1076126 RepID=A0A6V8KJ72_9ACTN|nr:hypothetical protein Phou_080840 [Phytohabitans houttuyneae]